MTQPRVAVLGAGITGLTAAYRLQQRGCAVTVFEASGRVGGKISTGEIDGIRVEEGPDAFLPRDDRVVELCREIGIDDLVSPAVFGAYIWHAGALRRLPPGSPYGIPRDPRAAWREGLLSAAGAARASLERLHRSPLDGPDVSVAEFVRARFGREVLDRLVDPLLAGVRGGRVEEMSLAAAAKEIDALARARPSVLRALDEMDLSPPRFVAPGRGMQELVRCLAASIDDIRTNVRAEAIDASGGPVTVVTAEEESTFDGAIVALPAYVAADVLASCVPEAARLLRTITYASIAVITLVYPEGSYVPPPNGSGFLVPRRSGLTIAACTWYSTKWPHAGADGRTVLRCVVGRAGDMPELDMTDDQLCAAAHCDLVRVLALRSQPLAAKVSRWERSIPEYRIGHLQLVADIEREVERVGPLVVAGAGYRGSGIPDCVAGAEVAASRLTERLHVHAR